MSEDRFRALLAAAAFEPCLLCGDTSAVTGVFTPHNLTDGKQRHVFYALCEDCLTRPNREVEVELEITLRGVTW